MAHSLADVAIGSTGAGVVVLLVAFYVGLQGHLDLYAAFFQVGITVMLTGAIVAGMLTVVEFS